jgi:hypothetical protein
MLYSFIKTTGLLLAALTISFTVSANNNVTLPNDIDNSSDFSYLQLALNTSVSDFTRDYDKDYVGPMCGSTRCQVGGTCCQKGKRTWCVAEGKDCDVKK